MTIKKKSPVVATVVDVASDSLEESVVKEERKSPVTQVVEVIEDEETHDAPDQTIEETPQEAQETESDEKRRELVDELFQKKPAAVAEVLPEISVHRSQKKNPVISWAIGIVTACLVIGGALIFFSGKKLGFPSIVVIPTPIPTAIATPIPTPVARTRDSFIVQVLNGGGVKGAATKMKTLLESKGYTVKDTGNTEEYSYDTTEIHVKSVLQPYLSMIETDLKTEYSLGTSAATLEDSVAFDVRIIVGKE